MFLSGICEEAAFEKDPECDNSQKKQGATPSRKRRQGISFESSSSSKESCTDDTDSKASTLILEGSPQLTGSSPEAEQVDGKSTY